MDEAKQALDRLHKLGQLQLRRDLFPGQRIYVSYVVRNMLSPIIRNILSVLEKKGGKATTQEIFIEIPNVSLDIVEDTLRALEAKILVHDRINDIWILKIPYQV